TSGAGRSSWALLNCHPGRRAMCTHDVADPDLPIHPIGILRPDDRFPLFDVDDFHITEEVLLRRNKLHARSEPLLPTDIDLRLQIGEQLGHLASDRGLQQVMGPWLGDLGEAGNGHRLLALSQGEVAVFAMPRLLTEIDGVAEGDALLPGNEVL